jgi:hypothetical protein
MQKHSNSKPYQFSYSMNNKGKLYIFGVYLDITHNITLSDCKSKNQYKNNKSLRFLRFKQSHKAKIDLFFFLVIKCTYPLPAFLIIVLLFEIQHLKSLLISLTKFYKDSFVFFISVFGDKISWTFNQIIQLKCYKQAKHRAKNY